MSASNKQRLLLAAFAFIGVMSSQGAPPRVTDDRYKLERVAIEPEIVTPTGMAFDSKGRLLVIESHTHQRPDGYDGPKGDRICMFADSTGDGRLDKWSTFAEGFRHAMNLLARDDGSVYVVERGRVLLLHDTNDDGVADKQQVLLRLETEDDYPHNALGGIDQTSDGSLIIGLGENHGLPFKLVGADGKTISGTGGLDGFFRCTADGKNLEHIARGVWNPFSLCVLPDGRIFAVDNDPDSSPPCRLLHVVEGGDYGYLYQYGRAGTHPLQAWNGELPGTLPMVCGTGEAPTAIVAHAGGLWVTSWGDHRIERYRLMTRGSSWCAELDVIVQGDADFRPTGMAAAPDGSIYFGDWVLRDYPVHRHGRIWRLSIPKDEHDAPFPLPTFAQAEIDDSFNRARTTWHLSRGFVPRFLVQQWNSGRENFGSRLNYLNALRMQSFDIPVSALQSALQDKSPEIRLYAVRWIADDRILELRDDVAKLLEGPPPSTQYYLAVLAAVDWLDHEPAMRGTQIADELLVRELRNSQRSPEAHALALRHLLPDHKFLTPERLRKYLSAENQQLRLEAIRTLAQQSDPARSKLLAEIANDDAQPDDIRAEAIAGLSAFSDSYPPDTTLSGFLTSKNDTLRRVAEQASRLRRRSRPDESLPPASDVDKWIPLLDSTGDAEAGRRVFFNTTGPRCSVCHQYDGRGGRIGPALTYIGRSNNREQIIASILQPSREVAPHYQPWELVTSDGKTHVGLRQHKAGDNGMEDYVDSAGTAFSLRSDTIEKRTASQKSIMPDGLESGLSIEDLRDLVVFLTGQE
jgi:putative membrane-bound dehydrogenase-like protein